MRYRNELKFILSKQTAELIKRRISPIMSRDRHSSGVYIVNNLYLDDQYDTFYHEKQVGSYSRDKLRVRYYNNDLSFIRLENKHKDGELAYKQSVKMTENDLSCITAGDFGFAELSEHPLWQKVSVIHRTRRLRPAAAFSYIREAYVYDICDVRITFDTALKPDSLLPGTNTPSGEDGVMEVKYSGFLPSVIAMLLCGLPLTRTEFSKYCYIRERNVVNI
ncbi:MAG: polyphosphate polymerase domain-containing protein [Oscillospiraceae bacterium]|nr:polyphosphate polymerase domain-containing protein [Oscillospiraceae bacterium]